VLSISIELVVYFAVVTIMYELVRDTVLGHAPRLATKEKVFLFEEESDLSLCQRYIDKDQPGRMAHHGHTGDEEKNEPAGTLDAANNNNNIDEQNLHSAIFIQSRVSVVRNCNV
jgi:hypothetical protein